MSTASAAERPEGKGWGAWGAHHEMALVWIMAGVGILFEIDALTKDSWPLAISFSLAAAQTTFYYLMVITMLKARRHLSRICVECIAQMPLNGQELAVKRKKWLHLFHINLLNSKVGIILNISIFLLAVGAIFIAQAVFNVVFFIYLVGNMFLSAVHRPLLPFCPWCRKGGGGGPHEAVPTPPPVMIKSA